MYNKEEIEKNFLMFRRCIDECLARLAETSGAADAGLIEARIETTLSLSDFFIDSVKSKYSRDGYIINICEKISSLRERYNRHKAGEAVKYAKEELTPLSEIAYLPA